MRDAFRFLFFHLPHSTISTKVCANQAAKAVAKRNPYSLTEKYMHPSHLPLKPIHFSLILSVWVWKKITKGRLLFRLQNRQRRKAPQVRQTNRMHCQRRKKRTKSRKTLQSLQKLQNQKRRLVRLQAQRVPLYQNLPRMMKIQFNILKDWNTFVCVRECILARLVTALTKMTAFTFY